MNYSIWTKTIPSQCSWMRRLEIDNGFRPKLSESDNELWHSNYMKDLLMSLKRVKFLKLEDIFHDNFNI